MIISTLKISTEKIAPKEKQMSGETLKALQNKGIEMMVQGYT